MQGGLPVAELIFCLCLLLPAYAYVGYPLLLTLLAPLVLRLVLRPRAQAVAQ